MHRIAIVADQPVYRAGLELLAADAAMLVAASVPSVGELDPDGYDAVVLDLSYLSAASLDAVTQAAT